MFETKTKDMTFVQLLVKSEKGIIVLMSFRFYGNDKDDAIGQVRKILRKAKATPFLWVRVAPLIT